MQTSNAPRGISAKISGVGTCTANTIPAPASAADGSAAISAPADAKSLSGIAAVAPAPVSIATVRPRAVNRFTVSAVAATRVSDARRSFSTARRIRWSFRQGAEPCAKGKEGARGQGAAGPIRILLQSALYVRYLNSAQKESMIPNDDAC